MLIVIIFITSKWPKRIFVEDEVTYLQIAMKYNMGEKHTTTLISIFLSNEGGLNLLKIETFLV